MCHHEAMWEKVFNFFEKKVMRSRTSYDVAGSFKDQNKNEKRSRIEMTGFRERVWQDSTKELTKNVFYPYVDEYGRGVTTISEHVDKQGKSNDRRGSRGLLYVFYKYGIRSSMNGVPFIIHSIHPVVKIAWSMLLAAAIGASIFHLYYLFSSYFEYEKYSKVNLKFDSLQFPAVTICNVNMMRISQRNFASKEIQRLFLITDNLKSTSTSPNYQTPSGGGDVYNIDDSAGQDNSYLDDIPQNISTVSQANLDAEPDMSDPLLLEWVTEKEHALCQYCNYCWDQGQFKNSSLYEIDDYFIYLFNRQSLKLKETLGHQLEGMVRMCSFAGRMCGHNTFKRVVSPHYGNCYTLDNKDFISRKSGPAGGLELILTLETDEYTPAITPAVGARVIIHEPGTAPFHDDNDMAVSPGMATFIALKNVQINRIGEPYSPCEPERLMANGFRYSKPACQKECEQSHIKRICHCYDSELDQYSSANRSTVQALPQCRKKYERECLYQVKCDIENNKYACDCKSPCSETVYEKTIATLQWPTDSYMTYIKPDICSQLKPPSVCMKNDSTGTLRNELVKLNIYYEDLNYETLIDQPSYEMINLLSDIGGCIGLWVGLSVISLFEMIHLGLEVIRWFTCRKWRKGTNTRHFTCSDHLNHHFKLGPPKFDLY